MKATTSCLRSISLLWYLNYVLAQNAVIPFLPQSFFFDWNTPGQPLPVPTTEQCQTIHITWSRSTATGPNPTAPYYLQVYTSVYISPLVISVGDVLSYDWAVPFAPGTLYQICMFDKFGNTGGCQATYTVIPALSTPTCPNVTFPPQLSVSALVNNGPMSQYGWVDQCTDISLTPTSGTPPFTLTVAPALHPPYNITVNEVKAINWTLSLTWATPFFISLVDAKGASWANGPLHAGAGGTTDCISGNVASSRQVKVPVAIGAGIGGLGVGALLGLLTAYFFMKRRFKRGSRYKRVLTNSLSGANGSLHTTSPPNTHRRTPSDTEFHIEPFILPDEQGYVSNPNELRPFTSVYSPTTSSRGLESVPPPNLAQNQIYVLHHDSNTPPVTIYHQDGTQIVELPPRYPPYNGSGSQLETPSEGQNTSSSPTDRQTRSDSLIVNQPRQPMRTHKTPRSPGP